MPHRDGSQPFSEFTAQHLARLEAELLAFDDPSLARGRRYFEQDRVVQVVVNPPVITGRVAGSKTYRTEWAWDLDEGDWRHQCSCPLGVDCKHAVALALSALDHLKYVPTGPAGERARREADDAKLAKGLLNDLRRTTNNWSRHRPLQQLLSGCPTELSAHDPQLQAILEEKDPDMLCARLAGEIAERSGGWLPRALEAYRNRPELQERIAERAREQLRLALVDWARQKRKSAAHRLRFVLGLRQRGERTSFTLTIRLTTPRMDDEPRRLDQLQQLRAQAQRTPGTLSLPELTLLNSIFDGLERAGAWQSEDLERLDPDIVRRLLERAGDTDLIRWADDLPALLAHRAGIEGGQPVRLHTQPVRVLPTCVAGEAGPRIELHCFFPNGDSVGVEQVVYTHGYRATSHAPSLIVARGRCWIVGEEPPATILESFREAGGLDLPADQRASILGTLATQFDHLRPVLRAHTRVHSAQLLVAFDLREDDWLQMRVFARSRETAWVPGDQPGEGTTVLEYTPQEMWTRHGTNPEEQRPRRDLAPIFDAHELKDVALESETAPLHSDVPDDTQIWLDIPDSEATEPLLAWLSATGAEAAPKGRPRDSMLSAGDVGWWLKATSARIQAFGEVWDRRPHGVIYLGNDRMRRMLSPAHRFLPKVKVKRSGVDFFAVSAEWEAEGMRLTDADLARLRSASTRFVKLPSGWMQRDTIETHDDVAEVLADLGIEVGGGEQTISIWQLVQAKPESLDAFERMGADAAALEALKLLRERIASFDGLPSIPVPQSVTAVLRPYQKQGLDFLVHASSLGLGAILADDMGLGKTVQALAWLEYLRHRDADGGPALVVCPTSVMHNWEREAARFTPQLRVLLVRSGPERHELWEHLREYDMLVTNYALLRRDLERWVEVDLRAAILDEAQNIKNPGANVSRAALQLKARHRLVLTGTPLENRALDLWSIVQFVNPGYLGNRTRFAARYDRLEAPAYVRSLLAAKLRPILLRRMKKEVAPELPERIEERIDCELTAGQRKLYLAELQRSRSLVKDLADHPDGLRRNRITILAALTRLRQICCHPALATGQLALGSGKFDALFELLQPLLDEGHKVLVFSQFVECLNLLRSEMRERRINTHLLTGQSQKREEIVRLFQESPDPSVFLISLKAGGTGLNLTAASYVVVFDPWWNPAVEAQAIDRTHRIGQDRTVIAYRLLTLGTIEEKIWELQQKKAALVRDVLGEDGFGRSLTREDLSYLLQDA